MSRQIGQEAETQAVEFLKNKGYEILERNFTVRGGEIDIIAKETNSICFIEVKFRQNLDYGNAADYITKKKMSKLLRTAKIFLYERDFLEKDWRIDAVVINGDETELLKNVYIEGMK